MSRKAFSLVEVLIAAAIAVLVIVPLSTVFQQSVHQASLSYNEIRASFLARELIEQMQVMQYVTGFNRLTSISTPRESDPWMDLSQPSITALFPSSADPKRESECRAFSRLFLTPLPPEFRRLIKLYPANESRTSNSYEGHPSLLQLDVMIEWKAPNSSAFNRRLKISTFIGKDDVIPSDHG
jgi:type II secretory pathway pseudopilin PulG